MFILMLGDKVLLHLQTEPMPVDLSEAVEPLLAVVRRGRRELQNCAIIALGCCGPSACGFLQPAHCMPLVLRNWSVCLQKSVLAFTSSSSAITCLAVAHVAELQIWSNDHIQPLC